MLNSQDFVEDITVQDNEYSSIQNDENPLWKKMIPGNMKEGTIYEDFGITVLGKFNFTKYDGKIILELQAKGGELSSIQVSSKIPPCFKMQVSDVNMPSTPMELPKVMVRCILMEKCNECPKIAFRFTQNG